MKLYGETLANQGGIKKFKFLRKLLVARHGSSQDMELQSFTETITLLKVTTTSAAKKLTSSTKISDHYIVVLDFFFVDGLFGSIHVMFNLNTVNFVEGVGKFLSKRGVWCRCLQL